MTAPAPRTVAQERDLPHPPAKVWRALTEPHLVGEWLLPGAFRAEVGHRFTFDLGFDRIACEVLEVTAPERLRYRWCAMGLDSTVTYALRPGGRGTLLRIEQAGFAPDQSRARAGAAGGWRRFLDRLDTLLDTLTDPERTAP